ncbi:MAG: hypothetical protein KDI16_03530 [Halioglobus sp.]|nr:hypothetical protein [Halioglobus sp.]
MTKATPGRLWTRVIALLAIAFGLLTVKEGGTVIFGGAAARSAAGDYVPFVLWFNFTAGFFYILAGIGLWLQRRWALALAIVIAAATLFTFLAFGLHVYAGGAYEPRTVAAMSLRSLLWLAIAAFAWRVTRGRGVGEGAQ